MSSSKQSLVIPSLRNILFATDFSQCSEAAFPYLRAIAERFGSTIHVVHVIAPEPMMELPTEIAPEMDADRNVAMSTMKATLANKPFGDIALTTTVKRGQLWPVLAALVEEKQIDLIVLGTHGRQGLKKLVLGSVAEQVFRRATCPVLTVGPQSTMDKGKPVQLASILLATDFSYGSEQALAHAESMARANNSHLILLHALSASRELVSSNFDIGTGTAEICTEFAEADISSARQQLTELIGLRSMLELSPEILVECGPAAETILRVAESRRVDLIVMGANRASTGSLTAHLPWAVASTVVCRANCPVLTVRS